MLVVGYTPDSYIVKNSWGEGWGEKGYVSLARGRNGNGDDGVCGVQMDPSTPDA